MPDIKIIPADNNLLKRTQALQQQVGNTPLFKITKLFTKNNISIYAKQEWMQLGGSVKTRPAYNIIRNAIEAGEYNSNKILLDATSGNTGIAYATIARELGLRVALCLPENASQERKNILQALGADIIYTSKFEGTDGAQEVARSLAEKYPQRYFYASQYTNTNNWKAHYFTTAMEIYKELPGITHFVAGLGTTGTFVGTGKRLRSLVPAIKLISLQPDFPMHGLEGWKHLETAIVPAIYDSGVADEMIQVGTEESYDIIKRMAETEGLMISPSSAANLAGAIRVAHKIDKGIIVTILPDNADKYKEVIKQLF
ncbi:MAG: cysteine synthase family protein [Ferruginibacter sp.]